MTQYKYNFFMSHKPVATDSIGTSALPEEPFSDSICPRGCAFSAARSARIAAIINTSTHSGTISIRMRARKHYVQRSSHVKIAVS